LAAASPPRPQRRLLNVILIPTGTVADKASGAVGAEAVARMAVIAQAETEAIPGETAARRIPKGDPAGSRTTAAAATKAVEASADAIEAVAAEIEAVRAPRDNRAADISEIHFRLRIEKYHVCLRIEKQAAARLGAAYSLAKGFIGVRIYN